MNKSSLRGLTLHILVPFQYNFISTVITDYRLCSVCKTVQEKDFVTIYVYKYNYFSSKVSPGCTAPNLSKVL